MSDRTTLESFFKTGDKPTQGQFADLITQLVNIFNDYGNDPAFIRLADVAISSAQILALNSSPITLVAAPGAGLTIFPQEVLVQYIFGTTAYTGDTTAQIFTNTANGVSFISPDLLEDTTTTIKKFNPAFIFALNVNQLPENEALTIRTAVSDPLTGDSTIRVFVTYSIVPV